MYHIQDILYTSHPLYLISAFTVSVLVLRALVHGLKAPAANVPGPWYTRFTSLAVQYYWLSGRRPHWVDSLHKKYGPIVRLRPNEVSIVDVQAAKEIHRISSPFLKSEFYDAFQSGQRPNVFSQRNPVQHSTRRRLLAMPMSESALKAVEPTVNTNIAKAIKGIGQEMNKEGVADVFKWFIFMSTDVIGELAFAESFRMLDQAKPNQYFRDLQSLASSGSIRFEFPKASMFLALSGIPPFRGIMAQVRRITEYSEQSFKRYEHHVALNPTSPKPTLFTRMLTAVEKTETLPRSELIPEGRAYIVAGSDTTAFTQTYLVYAMDRNPEVRSKLFAELSTLPDGFGWDDVRTLPYLNKVIDETLRLYGPVQGALPRTVPLGGAYLAGYDLSPGITVSTQSYSMHRDPAIFPNPDKFDPDRWDNPTPEMRHAYMPFGAGGRICLGLHLAKDELRMATAMFFRAFPNARVTSTDAEMDMRMYFLSAPDGKKCMVAAR